MSGNLTTRATAPVCSSRSKQARAAAGPRPSVQELLEMKLAFAASMTDSRPTTAAQGTPLLIALA